MNMSRLFVLVVWLLPTGFRQEFGREILEQVTTDYGNARAKSRLTAVRFVFITCLDLVTVAVVERCSPTWVSEEPRLSRDSRFTEWLADLTACVRSLRRSPSFTLTVVGVLALGIGVNTAVFSVFNTAVLRPFPFVDADRLVHLSINGGPAAPANFMYWRRESDIFEDVTAYRRTPANLTYGEAPERILIGQVSEAFFRVVGGGFARGRGFSVAEDLPGSPKTAVLSYRLWIDRFAGDPSVIGSSLPIGAESHTVIGVVGPDLDLREFGDPGDPDLFVPFQLDPNTTDQSHFFSVVAKLKTGVSPAAAQERLNVATEEYRTRFPEGLRASERFSVATMRDWFVGGGAERTLWILQGAVALVLLVVCANVAGLLLVRGNARYREIAIRTALGAGRRRILRASLIESILLSLVGGLAGLALGYVGIRGLLSVNTAGLPRIGEGGSELLLDWRVWTFALGLSLVTGVVFGLAPAVVMSRTNLGAVIKGSHGVSAGGRVYNRARAALVVAEVGLCSMLLVSAGLLIRTQMAIARIDPGFTTQNVVTMETWLPAPRFNSSDSVDTTARAALNRVRALEGVAQASYACCVPLEGSSGLPFTIVGRSNDGPFTGRTGVIFHSHEYFKTLDMPMVRGRDFTERDDSGAPPVVIINQTMVDLYWADGADPLADRIWLGGGADYSPNLEGEQPRQIVGVVADVRSYGIMNRPAPTLYVPQAQKPDGLNALSLGVRPLVWIIRTENGRVGAADVQEEIRSATGLLVTGVTWLDDVLRDSTSRQRFNMLLMNVFAAAALLLATIGVYGLGAYSVQRRTREIGIRMAIGAGFGDVRNMVLGEGVFIAASGILLGLAGSYFLVDVLRGFLVNVEPRDPAVFFGVPVLLGLVALAAAAIPARRASRVDPLDALRSE